MSERRRKIVVGVLGLLWAPVQGWLSLTWLFATHDEFEQVFEYGTASARALNIISSVLAMGGVGVAMGCLVIGAMSLMSLFDTD